MENKTVILKSLVASKLRSRSYKLNFAITSECNSACQTCNVWQAYRNHPKITERDLSGKEIEIIFKNLPKDFVWLSLSGGEPFLRKDLVEICAAAVKHLPRLGLISIPSNGLLEDKIVDQTKEILSLPIKNLFLNFSLDGPKSVHEKIRGIKGSFKQTWNTYLGVLRLSRLDRRLHVNLETTISRFNLDHLEKFFSDLRKDHHQITVTVAHTGYLYKNVKGDNSFTRLDHDGTKLTSIIKVIRKGLSWTSPIELVESVYLSKIPEFYKNPLSQPLPCIALKNSLALDSQGNVIPCFMWGKRLGNLRDFDYDLKKLLENRKREIEAARLLIIKEKCPNCWTPCEAYQSIINALLGKNWWRCFVTPKAHNFEK